MKKTTHFLTIILFSGSFLVLSFNFEPPILWGKTKGDDNSTRSDSIDIERLKIIYQCNAGVKSPYPKVCEAIEVFRKGTLPEETVPVDGLRLVDIGYVAPTSGKLKRELVIVLFSWSRNFHQKIYFPNKICTDFVGADNQDEARIVQAAIGYLDQDMIPKTNTAYQWAQKYDFNGGICKSISTREKRELVSTDAKWALRQYENRYVFIMLDWEIDGQTMIFMNRIEN